MPAIEGHGRLQYAVLWPANGTDGFGQPTVGDPVELDPTKRTGVRWDDHKKMVRDHNGQELSIDATVHVDREIPLGSAMWKGKLADAPSRTGLNVMEVVNVDTTPDLKLRHTNYVVHLSRYKNNLPGAA